jgi:hypothetical protein
MSEGIELWYVKLANGDVHRVTLDQLDVAFQAGHIDETTMVLAGDASEGTAWSSLGQLLGLDEAAPPTPEVKPAPVAAAPRAVASPYGYVSAVSATPPPVARVMPVAVANSLRPTSIDLGIDDLDDMPFRRRSGKKWAFAALSAAAVAGVIGFVSTHSRTGGDDITTVAAAAAMAAPATYAPTPLPVMPAPAPQAAVAAAKASTGAPAEASPMNPQFTDRFNETQKQKLLAADKAREDKAKGRQAGSAYHAAPKYKSTGFTTGGNKYDPLNSNL